jgi:phosphoribosyl 1,2-cyclic phosphate phosphodiesterase
MSNALKVTFLGTGTSMGVPVIGCPCDVCQSSDQKDQRLRSSIMIEQGDVRVVIDSGPDFRTQMLRESVKSLTGLVFTHEHKDHMAGTDDVRAFNFIQGSPVDVYATERVEQALRNDFHYAFSDIRYPGVPELRLHRIDSDQHFMVGGLSFQPILVYHHKLPVLGFRVGDFTYITDANRIPESEWHKLEGTKVLVLNALRKQSHISHFTLQEALDIIHRVAPESAWLTHISHQMGRHQEVESELPSNVRFAYDGLKLVC